MTDGQPVSQSWCRAPSGAHDQMFIATISTFIFNTRRLTDQFRRHIRRRHSNHGLVRSALKSGNLITVYFVFHYIHTLHFISQVQTNAHKNRHIKTKQAPVNKIIKTNFLCYAPLAIRGSSTRRIRAVDCEHK
jgi:hypothetical protein